MKYRVDGKEKRLSFGAWPDVSLLEARDKRDDAKRMLRESRDPGTEKKKAKDAPGRRVHVQLQPSLDSACMACCPYFALLFHILKGNILKGRASRSVLLSDA